jgi:inorganic pyrophosphatase
VKPTPLAAFVLLAASFTLSIAGSEGPRVVRFASFNIWELQTPKLDEVDGAGLGVNAQLRNAAEIIQRVRPDVLLVNEIDYDEARLNAKHFVTRYLNVSQNGQVPVDYPYQFFEAVNSGVPSGMDLDNDGKTKGPVDSLGYGHYPGQYGMALLSRFPLDADQARTFQRLLWKAVPGNLIPDGRKGRPKWYAPEEVRILPLSSKSHWDVPVKLGCQTIHLLASHPTPPSYDGSEDQNGRRNYDEVRFWVDYLDGRSAASYIVDDRGRRGPLEADAEFVLLGDLNADPLLSAGDYGPHSIVRLVNQARVFDPAQASRGALHGRVPGAPSYFDRRTHEVARIDYALPSNSLETKGGAVFWPTEDSPLHRLIESEHTSSNHRLVYVDIQLRCAALPLDEVPTWAWEKPSVANAVIAASAGGVGSSYSLPVPANLGVVPQTVQSKQRGGDGAPLDVIVLGPPLLEGSVAPARVLGLLRTVDGAARDAMLLAVQPSDDRLGGLQTINELEREFPATVRILEDWLAHHRLEPGLVQITGHGGAAEAKALVETAQQDFLATAEGRPIAPAPQEQSTSMARTSHAMRLVLPRRMLDRGTLTLRADLLDALGRIDWRNWHSRGTISAVRASDGSSVPLQTTVFETMPDGAGGGLPPVNGMHFYNGVGSVSFVLAKGTDEPPGDLVVTVAAGGVRASATVKVLKSSGAENFRSLEGTLSGEELTWSPGDGVIRLTGTVRVPPNRTLKIRPGTLVMVDPGPAGHGTAIDIEGSVEALGTASDPIYFFPSSGPPAMALPQDQLNNPSAWRGLWHSGEGASVYSYVFLVGAGNGPTEFHPRPPVIRLADGHSIVMTDCTLVDSPGKMFNGGGHGRYQLSRCLLSRTGIGGEFYGANHDLLIEDTWFTRIGRAPEALNMDGDMLHLDNATSKQVVRRCLFTDGGDDAIDQSDAHPVIEDSIIYDLHDKAVSLNHGSVRVDNVLIFQTKSGIRGDAAISNSTILVDSPVDCPNSVESSIIWPRAISSCAGRVNHTLVGLPCGLGRGVGNLSADPRFVDVSTFDFGLKADSPARSAGRHGEPIGWRGFPAPEPGK